MRKEIITVPYDEFRTNFIPDRYQLDRKKHFGSGQKSVLVKIDIDYYNKLKKICSQRTLTFNRAVNFAIVEFIDLYLIR